MSRYVMRLTSLEMLGMVVHVNDSNSQFSSLTSRVTTLSQSSLCFPPSQHFCLPALTLLLSQHTLFLVVSACTHCLDYLLLVFPHCSGRVKTFWPVQLLTCSLSTTQSSMWKTSPSSMATTAPLSSSSMSPTPPGLGRSLQRAPVCFWVVLLAIDNRLMLK